MLHIPHFQFDLISIPKLCQDMNASVNFTSTSCVIQGPSLIQPMVLGNLKHIYYCINFSQTSSSSLHAASTPSHIASAFVNVFSHKCIYEAKLWHLRLGHLPFHSLKYAQPSLNLDDVSSYICQVCPAARQTRLPFTQSSIKIL